MRTLLLSDPNVTIEKRPRAVALGLFDGVHLGHRRVIGATIGCENAVSCVLTFGDEAAALKKDAVSLCSERETAHLFEVLGVDEWLKADFTAVRELSPEAFAETVLVGQLHATRVCCGFNFHFGKGGAGDAQTLRALGERLGFEVCVVDELRDEDGTVSSHRIRRLLEAGEMRKATRLLGHPFVIDTPVEHGQALGRTLDFPTVNQLLPPHFVRPRFGVYTSCVTVDGRTYYGVSNLGLRPTVGGDRPLCETWIDGFDGDLYGRELKVVLTDFLRDEQHFPSLEALKAQIARDCAEAATRRREATVKAVLFDFDDTLQNRPSAFRRYVTYFLKKYAPHRLEDEEAYATVIRLNNSGYVDYLQFFTAMPKALGIENAPTAEVLFKEYQRIFPTYVQLFDDAEETLKALKSRGLLLGIVTNGPLVQQHRKLDISGLRPLLDTVVVSSEEGVHKPDPEIFYRAAARLGVSPSQCVFVGDHSQNDIEGALAAGMRAVFLDTRLPACDHAEVPALHTVKELLTTTFFTE